MRIRNAAVLAALVAIVGACSASSATPTPAATPAPATTPVATAATSAVATVAASPTPVTGVSLSGMVGGPLGMNDLAQAAIDKFNQETGNKMSLIQGTLESPLQQLMAMYASGDVPTVFSVDLGDVSKVADKVADLSNEKWVKDCNPELLKLTTINGQVIAFPQGVVSVGFLYNRKVIEAATGKPFDPSTIKTRSDLAALFAQIKAAGTAPIVVSPLNWSIGGHFLFKLYDAQGDDAARAQFVSGLKAGTVDLTQNKVFNGLMDTLDLMKKYNLNAATPLTGTQETDAKAFVQGKAAFWFMGDFAWPLMQTLGASPDGTGFGVMPVPISDDATDPYNTKLMVTASFAELIDTTKSTPDQQAAAKAWMNWFVYSPSGQDYMVNKLGNTPAFKNVTLPPANPLARSLVSTMASNNVYTGYQGLPADNWNVSGDFMLKYLAGKMDRPALAKALEGYWKSQK